MCGSDVLQALSQTSMWDEYASGVWKVSACACEFVRKHSVSGFMYWKTRNEEEKASLQTQVPFFKHLSDA